MQGSRTREVVKSMLEGRELIFCEGNTAGFPTTQRFTAFLSYEPSYVEASGRTTCQVTLFAWNPMGAVNGATLFVEMPQGTIVNDTTTGETYGGAGNLTLTVSTFIPFVTAQNIALDPPSTSATNEPTNFTTGRVTSAVYMIKSAQTSVTLAALSGTISYGVLNDLRNMSSASLAAGLIVQQTVEKKDAGLYAKIEDGMITVGGPDISPSLHQINIQNGNQFADVQYTTAPVPPVFPYGSAIASGSNTSPVFVLLSTYLSGGSGFTTIPIRPTSPFAPPEFELILGTSCTAAVPVQLVHYYGGASGGSPGVMSDPIIPGVPYGISVTRLSDVFNVQPDSTVQPSAIFTGAFQPLQRFCCKPQFIQGFQWLGTVVCLAPSVAGSITLYNVRVFESTNSFTSGPHRLMRIDNVAFGQQVTISGKVCAMFAPGTSIASYVQNSSAPQVSTVDHQAIRALFDDPKVDERKRFYEPGQWKREIENLMVQKRDRE